MSADVYCQIFIYFIITLSLATFVTDVTLGASGLWLGTRTGAGGTATPTASFFGRIAWLHGQQVFSFISNLQLR